MKKHVRTIKLSRETVRSLTSRALIQAAGGYVESETCSKNNHTCVASCSDVPCN